jgi:O-antigen/teichoic acid export membrane protein
MVRAMASRASGVLVPTFAHSAATDDAARTVSATRESVFITRALLTPALIALAAFGQQLLALWLGSAPPNSDVILMIFLVSAFASAPGDTCFVLLTGRNDLNFMLIGGSIAAVFNIAVSIFLTWKIGVVGPALGSLAVIVVWDAVALPRYVSSRLGIPWKQLSLGGIAALAAPAAAASAVAVGARVLLHWHTPTQGVAGAAAVTAAYVGTLALTVGGRRRRQYLDLFRASVRRSRRERHPGTAASPNTREVDAVSTE